MQKYVQNIFVLFLVACIASCGGGTSTTAATQSYDLLPLSLAPANTHMGGAVQGTPIVLSDGNSNKVSTMAGTAGSAALTDNSGAEARFNHPTDITTDGINFYVADYANYAIRQITTLGVVSTLQCTDIDTGIAVGFNLPLSLTTDGTNLYVVDSGSNTIRFINIATKKVTTIGSTTGLSGSVDSTIPTDVRFNQPKGITTDGVNLYVTDSGNQTVRRIVIATKAVSTLAGTSGSVGSSDGIQGAARFNWPARITTDGTNLYLTDFNNRTIRKIDIASATVTTLAGTSGELASDAGTANGIGTTARFNQPLGITTDGTNLYVTDQFQNTIRKVVISTGVVTTISGIAKTAGDKTIGEGGSVDSPGAPSFYTPMGITTDGTSLFVADAYNNTIRKIQPANANP